MAVNTSQNPASSEFPEPFPEGVYEIEDCHDVDVIVILDLPEIQIEVIDAQ